jgi:pyrimidine-nucleoside phosphorylase
MRAVDLIRRKRDSGELTPNEIQELITAYTRGDLPDYQMSAWLMAVVLRGMTRPEIAALTEAMLHSGRILDFSDLAGHKVDKHSTGGVGDKTSLIIAPIVAAGGLKVPMISGRGLGHSGGTLDKLESIPGFNVNLTLTEFRHVLETCGCSLIGQTAEIAPADKKIYALRDVTGTVESQALICASIMSKKLAEGIDALVLDVKTGSGAFMKKLEDAAGLAELLVETGRRMGKRVVALLTDMNQPLGRKAGNAMEVAESIEVLAGGGPADLRELCLVLASWMFVLGERVKTLDEGKRLAHARQTRDIVSAARGFVASIECERLGVACVVLGGGREKKEDKIDPAVGLEFHKRIGDAVERDEPLCTLHYNSDARLTEAVNLAKSAYSIEPEKPGALPPLVYRVIGA